MSTTTTQPDQATTTWTIDPQHSQVEFEVEHMMFAKVRGRFGELAGTIELASEEEIESSRVEAVIDAASIDTGQDDRDEHLRSADFFDVEQYPELRFQSRAVERGREGSLTVTGELTIRDVTRDVELDVTSLGGGTDPWGNERVGFRGTTIIDRREFGLTWNQALEAGGVLVGHEIGITLEIQAVQASG